MKGNIRLLESFLKQIKFQSNYSLLFMVLLNIYFVKIILFFLIVSTEINVSLNLIEFNENHPNDDKRGLLNAKK